jgi:predicted acylesterase/phospholipase RssA
MDANPGRASTSSLPGNQPVAAVPRSLTPLNLALQGGGAHGAFTWGVLDRLLADDAHLQFEGLSGSSAGAINAVVMADGWLKGGRAGAREALAVFWLEVGKLMPPGLVVQGQGDSIHLSAASKLLVSWAGHFSPAQINPLELNPLRDRFVGLIDFEALRERSPFKLFVAATQANTGKLRIFREHEMTADMLMASACLPKIHHPVDIEGEPYWDGGYSANPAVFPLFYECDTQDVLRSFSSGRQLYAGAVTRRGRITYTRQAMRRSRPSQYGARSLALRTLPAPEIGNAPMNSTLRGHL